MSAPVRQVRFCSTSTNDRCVRTEFRCFTDRYHPFESEMPSYASVPREVQHTNPVVGQNVTVYMQYPEWKTSGAV